MPRTAHILPIAALDTRAIGIVLLGAVGDWILRGADGAQQNYRLYHFSVPPRVLAVGDVVDHAHRKRRIDRQDFLRVNPDLPLTSSDRPVDLIIVLTSLYFGNVGHFIRLILYRQVLRPADNCPRRHIRMDLDRNLLPRIGWSIGVVVGRDHTTGLQIGVSATIR